MELIRETGFGMYSEQTPEGQDQLKANARAAVAALENATQERDTLRGQLAALEHAANALPAGDEGRIAADQAVADKKQAISDAVSGQVSMHGRQGRYDLSIAPNVENARFLSMISGAFDNRSIELKTALEKAFGAVTANASDPAALARYQAALAEYTLYRNAQSNAVKAYKDVDANTIRNFN